MGAVYVGGARGVAALHIDDPVNAFAVHGCAGLWGVIATGLLDIDGGWLMGHPADAILTKNLYGALMITLWVTITSHPILFALKAAGMLRVDEATELIGLDVEFCLQHMSPAMLGEMNTKLKERIAARSKSGFGVEGLT